LKGHLEHPIGRDFDLIAGTSTGGIIDHLAWSRASRRRDPQAGPTLATPSLTVSVAWSSWHGGSPVLISSSWRPISIKALQLFDGIDGEQLGRDL
jgi:hypothetical protein